MVRIGPRNSSRRAWHDGNVHGLATRSTRWRTRPALSTSRPPDDGPDSSSRARRPPRYRAGLPSEPGRGFSWYLALFAKRAVLAAKPPELLELQTRQTVLTTALVAVRLTHPILACFHGITAAGCAAGCVHGPVVVGSGRPAVERPEFQWVNAMLGNLKSALRGTCHAICPKYAQRYLSELESRFNRRFDLPDIIPRLVYVALRTPPMPERLFKLRLGSL